MCERVGIENGKPEVGSFVDQTAVFEPEREVVVDVEVGTASVNEGRPRLSVGPGDGPSAVIGRVEGQGSGPRQGEGPQPKNHIGSGY